MDVLNPDSWGERDILGAIARYNGNPGNPGWTYPRMAVHQHSDKGNVPGISTVDRDAIFNGHTLADLTLGGDDDMFDDTDRAILRTIANQLTGDPAGNPWSFPGWQSMVDATKTFTPVDYLRLIDLHTCQANDKLDALAKAVAQGAGVTAEQIAEALQAGLTAQLLPVLQDVVTTALGADNADQAQRIAADVVTELGQRLAGTQPA